MVGKTWRGGDVARAMNLRHMVVVGMVLVATGCEAEKQASDSGSETEPKAKKTKKNNSKEPSADGSAVVPAAAPAPKELPSPVDLSTMTWKEGEATRALVETDLTKRCLIKGMKITLPEGAPLSPLMGTRGCVSRAWGGEKGPYLFLVSDELPVKMPPRDEIKGIKRVVEETDNSWLAEYDDKTGYAGRFTTKIGKRTYYCVANGNGVASLEVVRGMMKLCGTLSEVAADGEEPKAAAPKAAAKPADKQKHAEQQNNKLKGMFGK